jgi:anti-sigma factor ChrR (cupin superfamily)
MEPIARRDRKVANIRTGRFKAWDKGRAPGQSVLQVDDDAPFGVGFHVFRMEPGAVTTAHEHTSNEQFYVIEGDLIDHDGTEYGPGDLVCLKRGTIHNSTTRTGCLLVVYLGTEERTVTEA